MVLFFSLSDLVPFVTERLVLRKFQTRDAEDIFSWASDPEIAMYEPWEPLKSFKDAEANVHGSMVKYNQNGEFDLAIESKSSGGVIGIIGISHIDRQHGWGEVGYVIGRKFWNNGFATEALKGFITFAFRDLGMYRLESVCMIGNDASERVMQKAGMEFESIKHGRYYANGTYHLSKMYYVLNT